MYVAGMDLALDGVDVAARLSSSALACTSVVHLDRQFQPEHFSRNNVHTSIHSS
jgi:hypothetical protein